MVLCIVDLFFGLRVARESSAYGVSKPSSIFSNVRHEELGKSPGDAAFELAILVLNVLICQAENY